MDRAEFTQQMDFSHYNVIVKQVDGVSDVLRDVEARVLEYPGVADDQVAQGLLRNLQACIVDLDVRAIKMLALYDPAAKVMRAKGVKYDTRRDMLGQSYKARARRKAEADAAAAKALPVPKPTIREKVRAIVQRRKDRRRR